jgi:hypothetical protein
MELRERNAELDDAIHKLKQQLNQERWQHSSHTDYDEPTTWGTNSEDSEGLRQPETEYSDMWMREYVSIKTTPTWEEYWQRHQYISLGQMTEEVERKGYGPDSNTLWETRRSCG